MFAYPVIDGLLNRVVYVVNVVASEAGRFRDIPADREKIEKTMEIFGERMVLENRLDELKQGIKAKHGGGEA